VRRVKKMIRKIFQFINRPNVYISTTGTKVLGYITAEDGDTIIKISKFPRSEKSEDGVVPSPAATLVHEIIHEIFPNSGERKIRKWTKKVWKKLSNTEKLSLYELLFENQSQ